MKISVATPQFHEKQHRQALPAKDRDAMDDLISHQKSWVFKWKII